MAIDPTTAIVGKTLWLRGKDLGAGGSTVTSWTDQAGTGLSIPASGTPSVVAAATPSGGKAVSFPGSTDQFLGNAGAPPIAASSYFSTSFLPSNLLDGSTATSWSTASGVGTGWARIFLNTAYAATSYVLTARGGATGDAPKDFTFEGSNNDGATWTVLDTQVGVVWSGTIAPVTFTITNSTAYRSYRLNVTAAGTQVQLSEFSIPGATPSPAGEAWLVVKGPPTSAAGNNASALGGGTATTALFRYTNGDIYDLTGRSARKQFTPTAPLAAQWYLIRVTSDGTWTYYIDGVSQSTEAVAATWRNNPQIRLTNGQIAEILVLSGVRTSGEVADLITYFNTEHGLTVPGGSTASTTGAANLSGPLGVVSGAGVVTVTGAASTAGPLGSLSATGFGPTTGGAVLTGPLGSLTAIGVSVATGSATMTGPLGVLEAVGTSDDTSVGFADLVGPLGALTAAGAVITTGAAEMSGPLGSVAAAGTVTTGGGWTPGDTLLLSAQSPVFAALASFEVFTPASDVLVLSATVVCEATLRIHPVPVPVPTDIVDRPIMARRHLMSPKTEAQPRKMGDPLRPRAAGTDGYVYPIEENDLGRLRVFASGIDITYLAGAPTTVSEWSFAKPFGPQAASFTVPLPEWNYPGPYGNMPIFWGDAPIEICLEDSFGTLHHLWEGYTGEESDTAAPGQTGVTWNCEGTFQQAAHWLCDQPGVAEERDAGWVIADLLNGVPNRRWNKIKRFTTGHLVSTACDPGESVLARVAAIIGETFDDSNNQLGLHRVGPYAYQLGWNKTVVAPDWSFTKGSPGFNMTLARPHNARRDMVFGRGIAPDGGFWMNRKFPGLASASPPVYPMASAGTNISVGTTDADTVGGLGVTTWQRRMRELGYPVTVDGVMNPADTKWVLRIQEDRGITVDGSLGPQTWSATWEGGANVPETTTIRLPLDSKPIAREFDRDASGAIVRPNPLFDKQKILHATPEVDFGTNIKKSTATPMARQIRYREASPGYVGSLTLTGVDPKEAGSSRFFVNEGDNILIDGHHNGIVVQVSDVTHTPTTTRMTVDSGARGQAVVDAVLTRRRDLRRSPSGKSTRVTDRGTLNASQLGQYESESPAGKYSRTAINGDSGLWTVRCIYVAEQGLARFRLTSSPRAEIVTLICGKRITANQVAAIAPNPLSSSDGWYDAEKELTEKFGLVNVAGTPDNPGGYYPREKTGDNAGPLTGVQAAGNLSMKSQRGGFFWVAVFTSRSTFVEGEFEPEVSTA